jgi:small redox-active disulfide protein 1
MTQVKVLKSPACSRCAQAMALLEKIRGDYPDLSIEEVDIMVHPEEVLKYQLMTSPGIVINDKLEFVGVPKEEDLRQRLAHD